MTNADGSVYRTGMEFFNGGLAGRTGSFILRSCETGELNALRGTGGARPSAAKFLGFSISLLI